MSKPAASVNDSKTVTSGTMGPSPVLLEPTPELVVVSPRSGPELPSSWVPVSSSPLVLEEPTVPEPDVTASPTSVARGRPLPVVAPVAPADAGVAALEVSDVVVLVPASPLSADAAEDAQPARSESMKTDRADTTRTVHAGRYGRWAMLRIRVLFFTRTPDHAHILGATLTRLAPTPPCCQPPTHEAAS